MVNEFIVIPITVTAILGLLSWMIIGSKGWWWVKVLVTAVVLFLGVGIWQILDYLPGWPIDATTYTSNDVEKMVRVLWTEVEEPNLDNPKGSIYIIIQDISADFKRTILGQSVDMSKPRMFEIPYTKEGEKLAREIQRDIKKGRRVYGKPGFGKGRDGKFFGRKGKDKGKDGKGKDGKGGKGRRGMGGDKTEKYWGEFFYRMAPPKMPRKNPE